MSTKPPTGVFCGPQSVPPRPDIYKAIHSQLWDDKDLGYLAQAVVDLPKVWSRLVSTHGLCEDSVGAPLKGLSDWIASDDSCSFTVPESLPNVLIAPLAVLSQLVQYVRFLRDAEQINISHADIIRSTSEGGAGVQGLCTGFLVATVLACSRDLEEVMTNGAVAIRLAMCIGAVVDADEREGRHGDRTHCLTVFGGSDVEQQVLMRVTKRYSRVYTSVKLDSQRTTLTLPADDVPSLSQELKDGGLRVKPVALRGRYHHSVHHKAVADLMSICKAEPGLQFPPEARPLASLRNNSTGALVQPGDSLHQVCLRSLLLERADWHTTISASLAALEDLDLVHANASNSVLELGFTTCLPRPSSLSIISVSLTEDELDFQYPDNCIAIVGAAGRFAGADNLDELWEMIRQGSCSISTTKRNQATFGDSSRTQSGAYLSDVASFDHRLFRYSPKEAQFMDPQHRIALQVAYEAVEGSGYLSPARSSGKDVGCYVGIATSDYDANIGCYPATAFSYTGTGRSFVSGRISRYFGWTGPSMAIDTACSSSAVAITMACKALITNDCAMALAGGVNVISNDYTSRNLEAASFLSASSGPSRSFDEAADGFCRGEGCGFVLLKRLSDAIQDGDQILGVVLGTSTNQNNSSDSLTAPIYESQVEVLRRSVAAAGIEPQHVSYIEAHGPGTRKGDPIEYRSIRQVFVPETGRMQPLYVGSLKANVGHAEAASGVAGVLKVLLMMQHRAIPPQVNFTKLNSAIAPLASPHICIPRTLQHWKDRRRIASIHNLGASGNNTALIVCEPMRVMPRRKRNMIEPGLQSKLRSYPFLLCASSKTSLEQMCKSLDMFITHSGHRNAPLPLDLQDLAFQVVSRQNHRLQHRVIFRSSSLAQAQSHLRQVATSGDSTAIVVKSPRPVVLVFAGQNGTLVRINRDMYEQCVLFRSYVDRCDDILQSIGRPSIIPHLFQSKTEPDPRLLHCMLFIIQYSCAMAWIESGLPVQKVIGHSIGQLTALCVAGCIDLESAVRLIDKRASCIMEHWGSEPGVMLAIHMDRDAAHCLVSRTAAEDPDGGVEIACYNAHERQIMVGTESAIAKLEGLLPASTKHRRLRTTHGFHSKLVDPILESYGAFAEKISYHEPKISIETCSVGGSWSHATPELLVAHTRQPVYFVDAIERIQEELGPCVWLEAGSGTTGITLARQALKDQGSHSFYGVSLDAADPIVSLQDVTERLWAAGVAVQFWLYHPSQRPLAYAPWSVPGYQFDGSSHWLPYRGPAGKEDTNVRHSPTESLISLTSSPRRDGSTQVSEFAVNTQNAEFSAWLSTRLVLGLPLCSLGMYLDLVVRATGFLNAGKAAQDRCFYASNITLPAPLGGRVHGPLTLSLGSASLPGEWDFSIDSNVRHASGRVAFLPRAGSLASSSALNRFVDYRYCQTFQADPAVSTVRGQLAYVILGKVFEFPPSHQAIQSMSIRGLEAVTHLSIPQDSGAKCSHPSSLQGLDFVFQAAEAHILSQSETGPHDVFVCSALSEIAQFEPRLSEPARSLIVYTRLSWTDAQTVICDSLVYDTDSCQLVATLLGARYTRVAAESLQKAIALVSTTPQPQLRMCKEHPTLSSLHQPPTAVTVASSTPRASVDVSPPTEQRLKEAVVSTLSMLLGIPISQISTTARLSDLGLDSLTSVELLRVFKENLQVDLARSVQTSTSTVGNLLTAAAASLQQQQHPRELVPRPLITPDASSVALTSPTDAISPFSSQCRSTATSDSLQQHCACAGCQVITRLVRIVAARLNGLATTILLDTQLEHLGLDSLATIDLEAELSTEFGRAFYIRQLPPSSTFCHLADAALAAHGLPSFADLHPPGDCGGSDISSYAHLLSLSPIP